MRICDRNVLIVEDEQAIARFLRRAGRRRPARVAETLQRGFTGNAAAAKADLESFSISACRTAMESIFIRDTVGD